MIIESLTSNVKVLIFIENPKDKAFKYFQD